MNYNALLKISYGMYIVSSKLGNKYNGFICNTVFQTTSEPPTVAVCTNKQNLTHEYITKSKVLTVSVLNKETPMKFIGHFGFKSGRDLDKFENINYKLGITGVPIVLDNVTSYLEVEVFTSLDVGTHTLFVGKVIDAGIINESDPLTYAYYHEIKNGKSPKTAPTYIKEEKTSIGETKKMDKYKCQVCGYVYDPEKGDPDSGIEPNTPFDKLPDTWVCPVCGVGKDQFEKE